MGKFIKLLSKIIYGFVVFFLLVIALAVSISYFEIPSGFKIFTIQSGSMEPNLKVGSVIFSRKYPQYIKNDIITFSPNSDTKNTTTHRIIDVKNDQFITKGDANNAPDIDAISQDKIFGKVIFSLPLIGYVIAFAKTQLGLIILIIIPATLIIYSEILNIKKEIEKKLS